MPIDEKNGVISSLYTADGKVKLPRTVDKAITITTGEHRGKTLDQVLQEIADATTNQGIALANEISMLQGPAAYSGEDNYCTCDPQMIEEIVTRIVEEQMKGVYERIETLLQDDIEILYFESPKTNFEKGEVVEKVHLMWELNVEPVSVHISGLGDVEPEMSGCVVYKKPITETTTFVLTVTDSKGKTKHASLTLTFGDDVQQPGEELPPVVSGVSCFYGTFTEELTGTTVSRGKKLKMGESTSIEITYHNERVFFAYPVSQGLLDDIKDKNGFSYIDSFIMEEVNIGSERYYAYYSEERASGKGIKFIFIL